MKLATYCTAKKLYDANCELKLCDDRPLSLNFVLRMKVFADGNEYGTEFPVSLMERRTLGELLDLAIEQLILDIWESGNDTDQ